MPVHEVVPMANRPLALSDGARRPRRARRVVREDVRLERGDLMIAPPGTLDLVLDLLADIEEAQAEIAHQPLVGRAGGEIDAAGAQIDRHDAGRVDDVGIDIGAMGVGKVADRLRSCSKPLIVETRLIDTSLVLLLTAAAISPCRCGRPWSCAG
jgi:hypothetical protein